MPREAQQAPEVKALSAQQCFELIFVESSEMRAIAVAMGGDATIRARC